MDVSPYVKNLSYWSFTNPEIELVVTKLSMVWHTPPRPSKKDVINMVALKMSSHWQKNLLHTLFHEILEFENSCILIGLEHFGPYLQNKNFPIYEIGDGEPRITGTLI